jgi:hypothetical protein
VLGNSVANLCSLKISRLPIWNWEDFRFFGARVQSFGNLWWNLVCPVRDWAPEFVFNSILVLSFRTGTIIEISVRNVILSVRQSLRLVLTGRSLAVRRLTLDAALCALMHLAVPAGRS